MLNETIKVVKCGKCHKFFGWTEKDTKCRFCHAVYGRVEEKPEEKPKDLSAQTGKRGSTKTKKKSLKIWGRNS